MQLTEKSTARYSPQVCIKSRCILTVHCGATGVPGMVGGMLRHMKSLRSMRRDNGWIHTLLEEAENERMHLLTFLQLRQPGFVFRGMVLLSQVRLFFFSCRSSSSHVAPLLLMLLLFFSCCSSSSHVAPLLVMLLLFVFRGLVLLSQVLPLDLLMSLLFFSCCSSSSHVAPLHLQRPGAAQPGFRSSSPVVLLLLHCCLLSLNEST